jgi:hypothetical protein
LYYNEHERKHPYESPQADAAARSLRHQATALVDSVGPSLADILFGRAEILECMFPGGNMELATQLYEELPISKMCNLIVVDAIITLHEQVPALHLFEIGSGTGGTTSFVLPVLSSWTCSYIFTDLSDLFLTNARLRFGG